MTNDINKYAKAHSSPNDIVLTAKKNKTAQPPFHLIEPKHKMPY